MLAAEQGKARYRRLADRAAAIYAPAVHGLGLATFLGWLLAGASWQTALTYAIAVLIITCPCALALAVPAVQIAAASRLFRRRHHGQGRRRARAHRRDRHGRVRQDRHADPWASATLEDERISDDALAAAAGLACASKHPYARAIVAAAEQRLGRAVAASGVEEVPGLRSEANAQAQAKSGSAPPSGAASKAAGRTARSGISRDLQAPVRFRFDDRVRSDAGDVVAALKRPGYRLALLSGDRNGRGRTDRARGRHRDLAGRAEARRQDRLARSARGERDARC